MSMPKTKLYFDGWLALPPFARNALELSTGDTLDIEVVDDGIVLRRADASRQVQTAVPAEAPLAGAASEKKPVAAAPAKAARRVDRGAPARVHPLPATLKVRGRRKAPADSSVQG
jgi:bifunctional DNA-binding transcriptional regulator/antitoxin component of YhaV-PrlF toxin-antitoxin module